MPTAKPRLQVTVTPKQSDLLRRLSKLQKRSMAAVLAELLETIEPVLERVAVVLEAAVRAQSSALNGLRAATEQAQAEVEPMVMQALGQLDLLAQVATSEPAPAPALQVPGEAPAPSLSARRTSPADPPALTGGSGRRSTVHKHRSKSGSASRKRMKVAASRARR